MKPAVSFAQRHGIDVRVHSAFEDLTGLGMFDIVASRHFLATNYRLITPEKIGTVARRAHEVLKPGGGFIATACSLIEPLYQPYREGIIFEGNILSRHVVLKK